MFNIAKYLYLAQANLTPKEYVRFFLKNAAVGLAIFLSFTSFLFLLRFGLIPMVFPEELSLLLFIISFIPLVSGLMLSLQPLIKGYGEVQQIEREIPFVTALFALYSVSGMPAYSVLSRFQVFDDVFPAVGRMAKRIEKLKKLFVLDDSEAIKKETEIIGSERISDIMLSALASTKSGIDPYIIFRDKMKSSFTALKESYVRLSETVKTLSEVVLMLFGLLPLTIFVIFSMFSGGSINELGIYSFVFNPFLAVIMLFLIDSIYPKTTITFKNFYKRLLYWIPPAIVVGVAIYVFFDVLSGYFRFLVTCKLTVTLFSTFFLIFFIEGIRFYRETVRLNNIDNALPNFSRDMAEEVKRGISPARTIVSILDVRSYSKDFDNTLKTIRGYILSGSSFEEGLKAVKNRLSWNSLAVFSMLSEASTYGGKGEVFEEVSNITRELTDLSKALRASLSSFKLFGLMTVILLIVSNGILITQIIIPMSKQSEQISQVGRGMSGFGMSVTLNVVSREQLPFLIDMIFAGLVTNAVLLGLLTGKMSEGKIGSGFLFSVIFLVLSILAMFGITSGVSLQ